MTEGGIAKALEIWSLQTMLDSSIVIGIVALGLALVQRYYSSLKERLTLRVSIELWNVATIVLIDISLVVVVIFGYLVLNPDIMADIKMGIPFLPVATILFAIALVLRLFYGGHNLSNPNFIRSVWLMFIANLVNVTGYSFVMEAPSSAYLDEHPSSFWLFLKTQLRSNSNLELSQITFTICFPILLIVFGWAFVAAIGHLRRTRGEGS